MLANLGYGPWAGLWGYVSRPQRPSVYLGCGLWAEGVGCWAGTGGGGGQKPVWVMATGIADWKAVPDSWAAAGPSAGLVSAKFGGVALVSNPRLICAAYRGKLNSLFQDEYGWTRWRIWQMATLMSIFNDTIVAALLSWRNDHLSNDSENFKINSGLRF